LEKVLLPCFVGFKIRSKYAAKKLCLAPQQKEQKRAHGALPQLRKFAHAGRLEANGATSKASARSCCGEMSSLW
jgi:hypothetical protein